jgi:uncharacterized YccA/Bax inhibitor family protein
VKRLLYASGPAGHPALTALTCYVATLVIFTVGVILARTGVLSSLTVAMIAGVAILALATVAARMFDIGGFPARLSRRSEPSRRSEKGRR